MYLAPSVGGTPPVAPTGVASCVPTAEDPPRRLTFPGPLVPPLPRYYTRQPRAGAVPPAATVPAALAPAATVLQASADLATLTPLAPAAPAPPAPTMPQAPVALAPSTPSSSSTPTPRPITRSVTGAIQRIHYQGLTTSPSSPSLLPATYHSTLADANWRATMVDEF